MKVILYMAITPNGLIAKKNNDTPWSAEEFASYFNQVKTTGNVIVGNNTYPLFRPSDFAEMGNPLVLILTRTPNLQSTDKHKFVNSPQQALDLVKTHGFSQVLVTGGAQTNASFLKENLIDEIYLDVEPLIFAEGIPLFSPPAADLQLELLGTKSLSPQTLQLHYKIKK